MEQETVPLLSHSIRQSSKPSSPASINQNCTNKDCANTIENLNSSGNENHFERVTNFDSPFTESIIDKEMLDNIGLSLSPVSLKRDGLKIQLIENRIKLRKKKLKFQIETYPIRETELKLLFNIYKCDLSKLETAENLVIQELVETVSETSANN